MAAAASPAAVVLSGKILDEKGNPVEFAEIKVKATAIAARADANGFYRIDIPTGKCTIIVSAIGYRSLEQTHSFKPGKATRNFILPVGSIVLGGVDVRGKNVKERFDEQAYSVTALDIKSLVNSNSSLNDIVDRSAGVRVRRDGGHGSDYDLSINGLSGNSIRYFIDGIPLDVKGSDVNLNNIPLNMVDHLEIYKGVVPAHLSSDALGGAVNIVTTRKASDYLDLSVGSGSFHTYNVDFNARYSIPKTKLWVRPTISWNYSKNDYKMKNVEIWDEAQEKYILTDLNRFHDDYRSLFTQLEVGLSDIRWADRLILTASYSNIRKDIQTGAMQNKVYGMAERKSHSSNIGITYSKRWGAFDTRLLLAHTWDYSATVDTAMRKYSWDGSWLPSSSNEITGRGQSYREYRRPLTVLSAGVDYNITDAHNLAFNYLLNRRGNKRSDRSDITFDPSNDYVTKQILSLTYTQRLLNSRLENTAFGKAYINGLDIRQTDNSAVSGSDLIDRTASNTYWGGGVGSRFTIFDQLSVKASYEHSVRLPLSREFLGNGVTIVPNLTLDPETSNNYNLGFYGIWQPTADHRISYEAGGFIRHVQNYIRARVSERDGLMQYFNEPAIDIKGVEFDIAYTWRNALRLSFNATYSDARDLKKYKTDGNPSATYKNKVPNRPWMFANAEASYAWSNLATSDDRLRVSYAWQWIHWYYLNWESYGATSTKARIPTQNISDIILTYSFRDSRYNFSLECSNIFDATVYDNYMLQKPGRAFYAKFRLFLSK